MHCWRMLLVLYRHTRKGDSLDIGKVGARMTRMKDDEIEILIPWFFHDSTPVFCFDALEREEDLGLPLLLLLLLLLLLFV